MSLLADRGALAYDGAMAAVLPSQPARRRLYVSSVGGAGASPDAQAEGETGVERRAQPRTGWPSNSSGRLGTARRRSGVLSRQEAGVGHGPRARCRLGTPPAVSMTVQEVADVLKLNQQTVRNWIDRGELPAVRVGQRRVRIRQSDLDAFIASGAISIEQTAHHDEASTGKSSCGRGSGSRWPTLSRITGIPQV
jgi:excisionase family DNA binding protein